MLQWILQHHLTENVLKFGLCAEAAVLLLEMVRFTVDKVSVLLQGKCFVARTVQCEWLNKVPRCDRCQWQPLPVVPRPALPSEGNTECDSEQGLPRVGTTTALVM